MLVQCLVVSLDVDVTVSLFVEKTILSPLDYLCSFVKRSADCIVLAHFGALCSFPLIKSDECLKATVCMQTMMGRVANHFPLKNVDKTFFQGT